MWCRLRRWVYVSVMAQRGSASCCWGQKRGYTSWQGTGWCRAVRFVVQLTVCDRSFCSAAAALISPTTLPAATPTLTSPAPAPHQKQVTALPGLPSVGEHVEVLWDGGHWICPVKAVSATHVVARVPGEKQPVPVELHNVRQVTIWDPAGDTWGPAVVLPPLDAEGQGAGGQGGQGVGGQVVDGQQQQQKEKQHGKDKQPQAVRINTGWRGGRTQLATHEKEEEEPQQQKQHRRQAEKEQPAKPPLHGVVVSKVQPHEGQQQQEQPSPQQDQEQQPEGAMAPEEAMPSPPPSRSGRPGRLAALQARHRAARLVTHDDEVDEAGKKLKRRRRGSDDTGSSDWRASEEEESEDSESEKSEVDEDDEDDGDLEGLDDERGVMPRRHAGRGRGRGWGQGRQTALMRISAAVRGVGGRERGGEEAADVAWSGGEEGGSGDEEDWEYEEYTVSWVGWGCWLVVGWVAGS